MPTWIKELFEYLGQYNFGQKITLIIVVPIVATVCIKILRPRRIGNVEFETTAKPKRRIFSRKQAK